MNHLKFKNKVVVTYGRNLLKKEDIELIDTVGYDWY